MRPPEKAPAFEGARVWARAALISATSAIARSWSSATLAFANSDWSSVRTFACS